MTEATISSVEQKFVLPLFGAKDQHLRRLREKFNVTITHRNGQVKISGENEKEVAQATDAIEQLTAIVRTKGSLNPAVFEETIARVTGESAPRKAITSRQRNSPTHHRASSLRRFNEKQRSRFFRRPRRVRENLPGRRDGS
jgi:phosphate starvation-inducible protein PhoH